MKTVSDDLFQLIKSLSKQEKRYFKLQASRHVIGEQNKYVLLFDAIDEQEEYDEEEIREQFHDEPFTRQLHVVKNYLYRLILSSLRNYHERNSEDKFYLWLRDAQLLFDKGLFKQSRKALNKARKSASSKERFLQLLEVYRWEHQIAHTRNDFRWLEQYVNQGIEEEFELLDKYRNFLEYQALNDRVFIPYWKRGTIRKASERKALRDLFDRPVYQSADHTRSFYANYFYHNARFSFHLFLGELEESYRYIRSMVSMFEELPDKKIRGKLVGFYSSVLINKYIVEQRLGKYEAIPVTLRQLRQVPADSAEQKRRLMFRSFNLEVDHYIHTGQFSEGIKKVGELKELLEKYHKEISNQHRLGLYYNLGYLYFGAEDYDTALDWINLLLNDSALNTREDIHCFGRLLNLIIHYELGNDQLLEYIVKSTRRFLSNRKRLFKVEAIMLKLMRLYPRWVTRAMIREGFRDLINELKQLRHEELERRAFEYFNFIAWMESKITRHSFEEIVRRGLE